MGRELNNKKSDEERKGKVVIFRLNIAERKKLDETCKKLEMTISELIRFRALTISECEMKAIKNK